MYVRNNNDDEDVSSFESLNNKEGYGQKLVLDWNQEKGFNSNGHSFFLTVKWMKKKAEIPEKDFVVQYRHEQITFIFLLHLFILFLYLIKYYIRCRL